MPATKTAPKKATKAAAAPLPPPNTAGPTLTDVPGADKIHASDTTDEANAKIAAGVREAAGANGVLLAAAADAQTKVTDEVRKHHATTVKDIEKVAADQDKAIKAENAAGAASVEDATRAAARKAGAFDTPVRAADNCQTFADYLNGYRPDSPCGHAHDLTRAKK